MMILILILILILMTEEPRNCSSCSNSVRVSTAHVSTNESAIHSLCVCPSTAQVRALLAGPAGGRGRFEEPPGV